MTDPLILRTERLKLTPFAKSDVDLLYKTFTDAYIRKYLWDDQIITKDEAADILNKKHERL